jgi:transcriptional regulator with XRE-family HTH domain
VEQLSSESALTVKFQSWNMTRKPRNVIGPQVRKLRAQRELSQEKLAVRIQLAGLDWGRVALAKVESRIKKVSDAELFILARVLGVEMSELFPGTERVKQFLSQ